MCLSRMQVPARKPPAFSLRGFTCVLRRLRRSSTDHIPRAWPKNLPEPLGGRTGAERHVSKIFRRFLSEWTSSSHAVRWAIEKWASYHRFTHTGDIEALLPSMFPQRKCKQLSPLARPVSNKQQHDEARGFWGSSATQSQGPVL